MLTLDKTLGAVGGVDEGECDSLALKVVGRFSEDFRRDGNLQSVMNLFSLHVRNYISLVTLLDPTPVMCWQVRAPQNFRIRSRETGCRCGSCGLSWHQYLSTE